MINISIFLFKETCSKPTEEDTSEPETPTEPAAEAARCHTPEGSSADEQPDELGHSDQSDDENRTLRPSELRALLITAAQDLAAAAGAHIHTPDS